MTEKKLIHSFDGSFECGLYHLEDAADANTMRQHIRSSNNKLKFMMEACDMQRVRIYNCHTFCMIEFRCIEWRCASRIHFASLSSCWVVGVLKRNNGEWSRHSASNIHLIFLLIQRQRHICDKLQFDLLVSPFSQYRLPSRSFLHIFFFFHSFQSPNLDPK